jgi:uncharacterized RDD family membrane protein YckC
VPGAPGRYFAATVCRVAAWVIDGFLLAILVGIIGAVIGAIFPDIFGPSFQSLDEPFVATSMNVIGVTVLSLGGLIISFLYFYLSWRSGGKATPGQRVFNMQVGNAFDGATLTGRQIGIRWLSLYLLSVLALIPVLAGIGGLASLIWYIVLLATTASSATKQGLHDRWAGSAVVATGPQNTGLAWGCLLIFVVLFFILIFVALAAIIAIFAAIYSLQ